MVQVAPALPSMVENRKADLVAPRNWEYWENK